MKQVEPKKLKIMMMIALGIGFWGILVGNAILSSPLITMLGVVNLGLGLFFGYRYRKPKSTKHKK